MYMHMNTHIYAHTTRQTCDTIYLSVSLSLSVFVALFVPESVADSKTIRRHNLNRSRDQHTQWEARGPDHVTELEQRDGKTRRPCCLVVLGLFGHVHAVQDCAPTHYLSLFVV